MYSGVTRRRSDKVGTSWTAGLSAFSRAAAGIFMLTRIHGERGERLPAPERTTMDDTRAAHDKREAEAKVAHDRSEAAAKAAHDKSEAEYKAAHDKSEAAAKAAHDRSEAAAKSAHDRSEASAKAEHDGSTQIEDDESKKVWRRD
jgi:hypothetical protein